MEPEMERKKESSANFLKVVLHPRKLGFEPLIPSVRAGWESFRVADDRSGNRGKWLSVTICNFRDPQGEVIETDPPEITILQGEGAKVKKLDFVNYVKAETICKYDVVYCDASPDTLTVDPIIILRP
jgi:hypothetical protein